VRAIAQRAGVNPQLISYYFGGKEGLYDEIMRRWHEQEACLERHVEEHGSSFADLTEAYLATFFRQPELTRILVWDGLNQTSPVPSRAPGERDEAPEVADLRRRQAAGEIAADLDPAYLLVALMGATLARVTMPQQIEHLCGVRADSEEFAQTFARQMRLILGHLAGDGPTAP
jgi:TetR/AcrR family transcriptional regulator